MPCSPLGGALVLVVADAAAVQASIRLTEGIFFLQHQVGFLKGFDSFVNR